MLIEILFASQDQHFQSAHHPCTHPNCLEQKFVVFASPIDLQAHQVEVHGAAMSGRQKKEKMRVEAEFFTVPGRAGPGASARGGGTPAGGQGQGRSAGGAGGRRAAFGGNLSTPTNADASSSGGEQAYDQSSECVILSPTSYL